MFNFVRPFFGALRGFLRTIYESPPVLAFLNFLGHCIEAIGEFFFWASNHPWRFVLSVSVGFTIGKLI